MDETSLMDFSFSKSYTGLVVLFWVLVAVKLITDDYFTVRLLTVSDVYAVNFPYD